MEADKSSWKIQTAVCTVIMKLKQHTVLKLKQIPAKTLIATTSK